MQQFWHVLRSARYVAYCLPPTATLRARARCTHAHCLRAALCGLDPLPCCVTILMPHHRALSPPFLLPHTALPPGRAVQLPTAAAFTRTSAPFYTYLPRITRKLCAPAPLAPHAPRTGAHAPRSYLSAAPACTFRAPPRTHYAHALHTHAATCFTLHSTRLLRHPASLSASPAALHISPRARLHRLSLSYQ